MRYFKKSEIILSEDTKNTPEDIRFSSKDDDVDLVLLVDGFGGSKTYISGAHVIDLDQIALAKWLYIQPDQDITISIDGGAAMKLRANKPTEMWVEFTALTINTVQSTRISLGVAGE